MDTLVTFLTAVGSIALTLMLIKILFNLLIDWYTRYAVRLIRNRGTDWIQNPELRRWAEQELVPLANDSQPGQSQIPVLRVMIEQHDGKLYAYAIEDSRFLAKGNTAEELIEDLDRRFRDQPAVKIEVPVGKGGDLIQDSL